MAPDSEQPDGTVAAERPVIHVADLDLGGEVVIVTDRDGTIVEVNDAFVQVTGYSRQEAIGASPSLLSSGQQDAGFYRQLWETISSGGVWRGELVDRRRDGTLRTHHATISPVRDGAGRITHFVAVERDVSGDLARQFAGSSAGSVHTDLDGRCAYVDARAAELLGRSPADLLGDGLRAALEPADAAELVELVAMAGASGRTHRLDLRTRDGNWLHAEVAPLTASSGAVIGATCSLEDVGDQLAAHRELARRDALLMSIMDAVPDPLAAIDVEGTLLARNRAWRSVRAEEPRDQLFSARVGQDVLATVRTAAAAGDATSEVLLEDLGRVLHGRELDRRNDREIEVTPLAWDEGGAVLRLVDHARVDA